MSSLSRGRVIRPSRCGGEQETMACSMLATTTRNISVHRNKGEEGKQQNQQHMQRSIRSQKKDTSNRTTKTCGHISNVGANRRESAPRRGSLRVALMSEALFRRLSWPVPALDTDAMSNPADSDVPFFKGWSPFVILAGRSGGPVPDKERALELYSAEHRDSGYTSIMKSQRKYLTCLKRWYV